MLNHYNIQSINLFYFYTYTFIIISYWWSSVSLCTSSLFINAETILPIQLHGLNYNTRKGPDWDPNKCKSLDEVITDLKVLSRITNRIRLLSLTDCNQGEIVLNAIKQGNIDMSLWLGMWVSYDSTVFEQELDQLNNMISSNVLPASNLLGITVGSEAIYRGEVTAEQIINNCNAVKRVLSISGIVNIPVAIVDIVSIYQRDTDLYLATDVVAVNVFQFFEKLDVNIAVNLLVDGTMPIVWEVANKMNKEVLIAETGWPSQGSNSIASDATPSNQARYFQDFYCQYDILVKQKYQYYYFTSIDTDWRLSQDKDQNSVEGHFGLFYSNLTLKSHFQDMLFSCGEDDSIKYRFDIDNSGSRSIPTALTNNPTPSPLMQFTGTPAMRPTLSDQISIMPTSINPTPSPLIRFTDTIAPTMRPAMSDQVSVKPTIVMGASTVRPTSLESNSSTIGSSLPNQLTISPTIHITNAVTHNATYRNASCSSNQYCVALSGNCCPTDSMEYLSCCYYTLSSVDSQKPTPLSFTTQPTPSTSDQGTLSLQATSIPTNQLTESTMIPSMSMKLSNREINSTNPKDSSRTENPSDMITNTTSETEVPSDEVSYDDTTDRNVDNFVTNDPKSEDAVADPIQSIDAAESNAVVATQRMLTTLIGQILFTCITIPSIISIILLVI